MPRSWSSATTEPTSAHIASQGRDFDRYPTDRNLAKLPGSIGAEVAGPESGEKSPGLFFTNAILCLKQGGDGMQEETQQMINRFIL